MDNNSLGNMEGSHAWATVYVCLVYKCVFKLKSLPNKRKQKRKNYTNKVKKKNQEANSKVTDNFIVAYPKLKIRRKWPHFFIYRERVEDE